jgi:predicted lipid-binding transport protein (Tim44 family)
VDGEGGTRVAFGPVGLFGCALLLLGILKRSRFVALLGLAGVVADVTVAELGGFKAMNETRPPEPTSAEPSPRVSPKA